MSTVNVKHEAIEPETLLTSYQVGTLLQVNPSSVNKWVKDGRIPAFRTPGGHRRIRAADLVEFLKEHNMPVPQTLREASRRRVLVVDKSSSDLQRLEEGFGRYEGVIDAAFADNAVDALLHIGSHHPHVVIWDVRVGEGDSAEAWKRIRRHNGHRDMQVLITTDDMTPELSRQADEAGVSGILMKPLDVNALLREIGISGESVESTRPQA